MLTLWIWRSLPLMASISFSVDRFADALAIQDEVARDAPDRAKDRFRQANEQALAVDAVDRCPVLPDQHSAAVKLLLHCPTVIFEQEVRLVLGDGVEQLGEEAGDTIFLGRVLIRGAFGAFGVSLGLFLPDQLREDLGGGVEVHGLRRFRARAQGGSSPTEGERDEEQVACGFDGGLVNLVG